MLKLQTVVVAGVVVSLLVGELGHSLSPDQVLRQSPEIAGPTLYLPPHGPHRDFNYRSVYGAATYAVTAARSVSLPFTDVTFNPALR